MDDIWTLMLFARNQPQVVVLQYKTGEAAKAAHVLASEGRTSSDAYVADKVTIADDYGRELTISPSDVQIALLQDIEQATLGNVASNVANNVANALTQVQTQAEIDRNPVVKAAVTRAQLSQGVPPGVIRS